MLLFIITIILLLVVSIIPNLYKKENNSPSKVEAVEALVFIFKVICSAALIIMLFNIPTNKDVKIFEGEYKLIKEAMEEKHWTVSYPRESELFKESLRLNKLIIRNKVMSRDIWVGIFYSSEIGDFEYIKQ